MRSSESLLFVLRFRIDRRRRAGRFGDALAAFQARAFCERQILGWSVVPRDGQRGTSTGYGL